jgi:hypothetical protein
VKDGVWRPAPPAESRVLAGLREAVKVPLPSSYFDQLAISNGGEGDLAKEPGWISFWRAEDVVELNAKYEVNEQLPGFFAFGSNGGGELLAFDARRGEPFPIVAVPFLPMDPQVSMRVAASFDELRTLIGKEL